MVRLSQCWAVRRPECWPETLGFERCDLTNEEDVVELLKNAWAKVPWGFSRQIPALVIRSPEATLRALFSAIELAMG